jgi:hypothetical protein
MRKFSATVPNKNSIHIQFWYRRRKEVSSVTRHEAFLNELVIVRKAREKEPTRMTMT